MADMQMNEGLVKARKRKPNFSINKIPTIMDNVEKNLDILQSKLTNVTIKKKTTNFERKWRGL